MECNHDWQTGQTNSFNDGGYMRMKFCTKCKTAEGYGFLDANHEINYLESMLHNET
jgi:hypothetical protein